MSVWRGDLNLRDMDPFTFESIRGALSEWQSEHRYLVPMDCFPGHLLVTSDQYALMAQMKLIPKLYLLRVGKDSEYPTFMGIDVAADHHGYRGA